MPTDRFEGIVLGANLSGTDNADGTITIDATGGGGGTFVGAKVTHSASQSISNTAWVTLAFNTETFDTDGIHDNSTNNSRLTCQTAGKYAVAGGFPFSANNTGSRGIRIIANGTDVIGLALQPTVQTFETYLQASGVVDMSVGQYVQLDAFQNVSPSASLNVPAPLALVPVWFSMWRIG